MLDLNSRSAPAVSGRINWHIDKAIDAGAAKEPKRTYLGASVLGGSCERAVQLYAQGVWQDRPASGVKQDIFRRGHWIESLMIERLRAAGFILADVDPRTGEQFEAMWMDGLVKGHPDGMLLHWLGQDECPIELPALWECKGLGSKWWKRLVKDGLREVFPGYHGQMQLLMGGFNLPRGLFTAVNADTMERHHVVVPFDSGAYVHILARAERIFLLAKAGEDVPRAHMNGDNLECRLCFYRDACWGPR